MLRLRPLPLLGVWCCWTGRVCVRVRFVRCAARDCAFVADSVGADSCSCAPPQQRFDAPTLLVAEAPYLVMLARMVTMGAFPDLLPTRHTELRALNTLRTAVQTERLPRGGPPLSAAERRVLLTLVWTEESRVALISDAPLPAPPAHLAGGGALGCAALCVVWSGGGALSSAVVCCTHHSRGVCL